jgi:hypothetical protein
MTTTVQAYIQGGLGNQLFIVATLLGIADQQHLEYRLKKVTTTGCTARSTYWDTVFHRLMYVDTLPVPTFPLRESSIHTIESFPRVPEGKHAILRGYFQSFRYFEHLDVHTLFQLPASEAEKVAERMRVYRERFAGRKLAFVHVRRGDYVRLRSVYPLLDNDWYTRALQPFDPQAWAFLVFSDDPAPMRSIPVLGSLTHVEHVTDPDEHVELFMMAACDGAIIANSTFSWWGAYLGRTLKNPVVSPAVWFTDGVLQSGIRNLPHWIENPVQK